MKKLILLLLVMSPLFGQAKAKPKAQPSGRTLLEMAQKSFDAYDFQSARENLDKYLSKRGKADAALDQAAGGDMAEELKEKIELGESMIDRVEQVEIIDSINVPLKDFFKFYPLPLSAGSLEPESAVASIANANASVTPPVFVTEGRETAIWSAGKGSEAALYETSLLADGSWEQPQKLMDYQTAFGDERGAWLGFPFLMADGTTMYFAADGAGSLGGLDIFITRKDEDGFLQPSNIGMPYNSTANDYMYAIDEQSGLGYWATDRHSPQGTVTIYTFIPHEMRVNYSADDRDLASRAQITSIKATQKTGSDYRQILANRDALLKQTGVDSEPEFAFSLPGGKVLTSLNQLPNSHAQQAMREFLNAQKAIVQKAKYLAQLRSQYEGGNTSLSARILNLEQEIEMSRSKIQQLSNNVVAACKQ